jgi:hypothetical protein
MKTESQLKELTRRAYQRYKDGLFENQNEERNAIYLILAWCLVLVDKKTLDNIHNVDVGNDVIIDCESLRELVITKL